MTSEPVVYVVAMEHPVAGVMVHGVYASLERAKHECGDGVWRESMRSGRWTQRGERGAIWTIERWLVL